MERQGVPFRTAFEQKVDRDCFSTDMGNVTYVVPSIHPTFEVCRCPRMAERLSDKMVDS